MNKTYVVSICAWLILVAMVTAQQTAIYPTIAQGTRALSVQGAIDNDGGDMGAQFGVTAGQFIMDYMEAGVRLNAGFRGSDFKNISLAGYGEYNFELQMLWFPYVGGSLGLGYMDYPDDDDTFLELQAYGGARYFIVDYASIGGELALKLATEDIYNKGKDSFDGEIRIRTTWYF